MKSLLKFAKNEYSQNGEDGILKEIFKRLKISKGWFVEFGAWDGKHMSNCYVLLKKGWSGVDIEGEADRYKDLLKTVKQYPKLLHPVEAFVSDKGKNSLDNLLKGTPIPADFDLLSVDIDSYDWYIWKALKKYNPKVVVIEVNSGIPAKKYYVQPNGIPYEKLLADGKLSGSSFRAMLELGQQKGYTLVCHTGNMIFVRNDLVDKLNLPADELSNPSSLFLTDWIVNENYIERVGKTLKKLSLKSLRKK